MSGVASSTCSRLSRTRSRCLARRAETSVSASGRSPASRTPRLWAIAEATSAGSGTAASGTKTAPSVNRLRSASAATASASRVLPTPPGPVSVSRRTSGRRRRSVKARPPAPAPRAPSAGWETGLPPALGEGPGRARSVRMAFDRAAVQPWRPCVSNPKGCSPRIIAATTDVVNFSKARGAHLAPRVTSRRGDDARYSPAPSRIPHAPRS